MPKSKIRSETFTIASGTTSGEINLKDRVLVGLTTPSGISSTTMKIAQAFSDGATYVNIQDGLGQYGAAGDLTFTIAASKYYAIPPSVTAGCPNIKFVFGSSETAKTFGYRTREI